jgi:ABC transporter DrrB family efflux protein
MTAATIEPSAGVPARQRSSLSRFLAHSLVIARRNLITLVRMPEIIVFAAIQPIMFVLLFRYVFGGAIAVQGISYVDFLVPGIVVQMVAFNCFGTALGVNEDANKGLLDRLRSLPMSRSAFLTGRIMADTVRVIFSIVLLTIVGYLVGFRVQTGIAPALLAFLLATGFGVAFCWIGAFIGLAIRSPEAVQSGGFIWLFPLTFISSAFAPPGTMPGWLQAFVEVNPVTRVVDALRALLLGFPARDDVIASIAWILGIGIVFSVLAVRQYRKLT